MIDIEAYSDDELAELSVHAGEEKANGNLIVVGMETDDGLIYDSLDHICELELERRDSDLD